MLAPQWERLVAEEPELAGLFDDDERSACAWLAEARDMLDRYFTLEDPTRLEPRHREHAVQAVLESGLLLRGYIDRLDVAAGGEIRIVDYKTGTAPKEEYEARALFQMKFYAVVLWLTQQQVPKLLQLIYLGNGEIVRYAPDESDLRATVRKIDALWRAIERARSTGDWRPRPSRLCAWCAHQAICPAFGGTPPPLPGPEPGCREARACGRPRPGRPPAAGASRRPGPRGARRPARPAPGTRAGRRPRRRGRRARADRLFMIGVPGTRMARLRYPDNRSPEACAGGLPCPSGHIGTSGHRYLPPKAVGGPAAGPTAVTTTISARTPAPDRMPGKRGNSSHSYPASP